MTQLFPNRETYEYLEEIKNRVKLLNCVAYYSNNFFTEASRSTLRSPIRLLIESKSTQQSVTTKNAAGSATVIYSNLGRILLLTAAHIVSFPDTLITYYSTKGDAEKFIESISIKINQDNYIADFPERGEIDVIVVDSKADLALIGRHYDRTFSVKFPAFQYPLGAASNLQWGSFVYAIGYPMNFQMVTTGIVSSPRRDNKNSFLIDANFNRGFSGGIVLGILDGVPNFELVGIISMVPASNEFVIRPSLPPDSAQINSSFPYEGDLFLDINRSIRYGVTKVTSAET